MTTLRRWIITGETMTAIGDAEARVIRLSDIMAALEHELELAQEAMIQQVNLGIGEGAPDHFTLDTSHSDRFIVEEVNGCPDCGQVHEDEQHTNQLH